MGIKELVHNFYRGFRALLGKETKDRLFTNHRNFPDQPTAQKEFERSKDKLFDVNRWSDLPGLTSKFQSHDEQGKRSHAKKIKKGEFIRIELPGPTPENWVEITDIAETENTAEFTVNPCVDPQEAEADVEHFFIKEASSTFKVELKGTTIYGYEIGKREGINNSGYEAGQRKLLNTMLAAGGWAAFQEFQWDKLTKYLVHRKEIKK